MGTADGKEIRFAGGMGSSCDNVLFVGALLTECVSVLVL